MNPRLLQFFYIFGGVIILPFIPFLYWQGQRVRKQVGRLPDATGETVGQFGEAAETLNLLAIGESTVAGVGAKNHAEALGGQLAKYLSLETGKSVRWHVLGESGITVGETLERLVPNLPETEMDFVVVALGGNDTFKVSSPNRWRNGLTTLIETLKEKYPNAKILLANTPRVKDFTALPATLKFVLWRISHLHHLNAKSLTEGMENIFYYDEAGAVADGFFSDGVHPSAHGYALWSEAMIKFLIKKVEKNKMNLESSFALITKKLNSHNEWLLIGASGKSFPLQRGEIEFTFEREKIIFGFLNDAGFQIWRVASCQIEPEKITLDLTRNFERELEKIRLVPRISASELGEAVELARLEKANQIARLIVAETRGAKLLRVSLNEENGRFAQITFEKSDKKQIAVLADVADAATPESLLTTAIVWLTKLENRKKPIETVWILAEKKLYKNVRKLHTLLRDGWKSKIYVKEISRPGAKTQREEILEIPSITFGNLWREKPPKISLTENTNLSQTATEIIKLAPERIDVIFTKHGETVRFFGLPFARVRRIADVEKAWFGIERERRILNESSRAEFFDLFENLETYRRFDSPNKRHALFRLAPEAWLESLLRRNIKLLDGNLILSPIHNQFRAANDTIDLLALRRDGRLIVIELKVAPDREMIFQAVDYWRKIELQRRSGNLARAKIFGDLEISNEPTLVFLAAPTLSFHRDFEFLAKTVSPEIEIYKFGLNESWRENLKVMKVSKVEK